MKTFAMKTNWPIKTLFAVALIVGLGGSAPRLQAQANPEGTWDFVLSGNQRGVAQITFLADHTLVGTEIITAKQTTSSSSDDNPRGGTEDASRGDTDSGSSSSSWTNFYGRASLSGIWTYDSRLRVIGVITESGGTNSLTNGISFKAVVRPTRMTMTGIRNGRKITYRGVPLTPLADISGDFYAQGKVASAPFTELFTLTPGSEPNLYDVVGAGPAYSYVGYALVSAKGQMAFVSLIGDPEEGSLRSVVGPYRLTRGTGTLKGVISSDGDDDTANASMKITKLPD